MSFVRHGLEMMDHEADSESQEGMIKWRATDIYVGEPHLLFTWRLVAC